MTLTQEGMTLGTPLYMSPEQAEGKKLDARSDLYSLGVTAYHLLAGAPPFRGDNPMAVAMKHLSATPRPLRELRPDLPPVLCEIVHKLMSRDPAGRYASAAELGGDLEVVAAALADESATGVQKLRLAKLTDSRATAGAAWPLKLDRFFEWPLRRHLAFLIPLCLLAGAGAAGAGYASRPADPFAAPPGTPGAARMPTAGEQFAAAALARSEDGWLGLLDYYGDDPAVRAVARDRLARWYLDHDRPADARRQADAQRAELPLANLPADRQRGYKADAEAVAALAALRSGDAEGFRRQVGGVLATAALRDALDETLRSRVSAAVARDRARFDDATRTAWEADAFEVDGGG